MNHALKNSLLIVAGVFTGLLLARCRRSAQEDLDHRRPPKNEEQSKPQHSKDQRYQSPDPQSINELAFLQGLRGLDDQNKTLANIRLRANGIAALSGLAATFLGRDLINQARGATANGLIIGALVCFVFSIAAVVLIYRPRGGWVFHFSADKIVNQFSRGARAASLSRTYEELGRFSEQHHTNNALILSRLFRLLQASLVFVVLQILCWIAAFAVERGGNP